MRVQRILVDKSSLYAVERQPELIESFLHGGPDLSLLRVRQRVTFHGQRSHFHMFFIHSHVQSPVANILRVALKAVVLRQTRYDTRHAFTCSAFPAEPFNASRLNCPFSIMPIIGWSLECLARTIAWISLTNSSPDNAILRVL